MALRRRCFKVQIVSSHGVFTKYVEAEVFNLGRSDGADINVLETSTSRDHITVYSRDSEIVLEDKNSTFGTFVNGERVPAGVPFRYRQGDPIKLGHQVGFIFIRIMPKYLTVQQEVAADPEYVHRLTKTSVTQNLNNWLKDKIAANEGALADNDQADTLVDHNLLAQAPNQKALEEQIRKILGETNAMANHIQAEAAADAEMMLKQARNTAAEIQHETEEKAKVTRNQLKIEAQEIQKALDSKAEQLRVTAQTELNEVKAAAQLEAEHLRLKALAQAQGAKENAEKQVVQILGQAHLERQKIKAEGEEEVRQLRAQVEKAAIEEKEKIEQLAEAKAQDTLRQAQSIKDDLLKGVVMQVDALKRKAEEDGQAQVAALKRRAEDDKLAMLDMAQKQALADAARVVDEAKQTANKSLQEARMQTSQLQHEAHAAAEKVTADTEKKVRDLEALRAGLQGEYENVLKQKETVAKDIEAEVAELAKAKKERKLWLEKTNKQNQELVDKINLHNHDLLAKAEKKAHELVANAEQQAAETLRVSEAKAAERVKAAEAKAAEIGKTSEAEAAMRIESIKGPAERERDLMQVETKALTEQKLNLSAAIVELKKDRETYSEESQELFKSKERIKVQTEIVEQEYAKAKGDKEKLMANFDDQINKQKQTIEQQSFKLQAAQERETQLQKSYEEFEKKSIMIKQETEKSALRRQTLDADIQKQLDRAEAQREEMIKKAEADCKEMKKAEEHALSVLRLKEIDAGKVRAEQEDAVRFKQQHQHAKEINLRLKQAFTGKIGEVLKSPHPDLAEKELGRQVGRIIDMVLNNESLTAESELKSLLSFNPEVAAGIRRFWYRAIAAAVVGLIVVAILINNRHWFTDGKEWLAKRADANTEQQAKYYEKMENEREEKRKFAPEQKAELQESYVDSVIFSEAFIEIYREEEFQKALISETNDLLIKNLRLNENVVPPFIGAESSLIDQLIEMREEINGEFPQEGIGKMRDLEQGTRPALVEMIGGEKHFEKYWKFRKKFFSNCLKERAAREVTSEPAGGQ